MHNHILPMTVARLRWFLVVFVACTLGLVPVLTPPLVLAAPPTADHAQTDEAEWLIMVYSDADDNVLEEELLIDMQEAELVGSTDQVTIIAQIDRFKGGYAGMGDWTTAKRFLITQDDDMSTFGSEELADLGEVNMADGATLLDFIEWGVTNFPARKRMLIMSDHGSGWPGGWTDPDPGGDGVDDIFLASGFGDSLWLMEIGRTLDQARNHLGLDYFDVIGFDACLMSQLEVYTAMAPHALYAVASEEVEPGLGWAYAGFLSQLVANPGMEGDELAAHIVATYIDEDMRLEDPEFVGNLSRQQAAEVISPPTTLSAIDLAQIAPLNAALNDFVVTLSTLDQNVVAQARAYAQSYESIFGDELPSPYIDLGHFSQLIQSSTEDATVLAAAQALDVAWQAAVIAEKHGPERPGSTGIAIYFPVRELYGIGENFGYIDVATHFAQETQWDEFLAFHVGGTGRESFARPAPPLAVALQQLMPELAPEYVQVLADEIAAMLAQGLTADDIFQILVDEYEVPEEVVAALDDAGLLGATPGENAPTETVPGESGLGANSLQRKPLQVGQIWLSSEVAYPDAPVTVGTEIIGERVAFVYSFIGRFLPENDILIIEDQDFIFGAEDITVGGVTYPKWPEGAFTVEYEWLPVVYAISDGTTSIRTLFAPETYGEEPTYTVEGIYAFADGSADRYARLFFRNGVLSQVYAFVGTANNGMGAPREITPQRGDQFTVFEQGFDYSEDGTDENYSGEIGTLTFGDEPFFIEETLAPSGNYMVGVIAEDLDGNQVESYAGLFVVSEDGITEDGFVPLVNEDLGFALLHPATWTLIDSGDESAGSVTLMNEDETALMSVWLMEYPDVEDAFEANLTALEDAFADLENDGGLENLEIVDGPVDFFLGIYDAQLLDFSFDLDGVAYAGELVAATPAPGLTYVVYFDAPAEDAEVLLPDFDAVLYSFDVVIPGFEEATTQAMAGASQPEFADVIFVDEYDDATSGLYDDEEMSEWGQGYYDLEYEMYVYAMQPASGAIYDYYYDLTLPDTFMVQVSAQSAGAIDTAYGLIFQVQDDDHFYAFRVSGDGYFLVEIADGEYLETLVDWTVAESYDLTEEAINTLAVAGGDGFYALYVNGMQVGEFADDSYGAGSAGYLVEDYDETDPAAFGFDDFVVGVLAE